MLLSLVTGRFCITAIGHQNEVKAHVQYIPEKP